MISIQVYVPTVFEMYPCTFEVDGRACHTEFYDTAGQEDYDALRPLAYSEAHIVFICFAIDGPDSLDNVIAKVRKDTCACSRARILDIIEDQNTN